ncbi:MAG: C1 family peptidase [Clostridiales bacterium]|nr:C1 family peptidase [Clostridiales bacterium]
MRSIYRLSTAVALATAMSATMLGNSPQSGGIDAAMMQCLQQSYNPTAADRAIHNALNAADINTLAASADNRANFDNNFTYRVPSVGITNQLSSGRCWLFTGLNVLRSQAIKNNDDINSLKLSQAYNFFFDQLEKSNLFLQSIIDTAGDDIDDRRVQWIFKNALSDGGQYTGISDNLSKYGVVPDYAMPETYISNHTSRFSQLLGWKLKEWGMELRDMVAHGAKKKAVDQRKEEMLGETYRLLALAYGNPPRKFTYTKRDSNGGVEWSREFTPVEFYNEFIGNNLQDDYVMFMNDPSRPYHKLYEIDLYRHSYDGHNWRYLNLPMEELKAMAIESIKDSAMMYMSCDVNKFIDRTSGKLDLDNYDYDELLGTTFGMDKKQRIQTGASGSTHAMTLVAVDIDPATGKPTKWLVENSWGDGPNNGHLVITDRWLDEYLFRLVVNKKYIPAATLELTKQQPIMLPPWDPMF